MQLTESAARCAETTATGYTLLEVLVALAIGAVGLLGLALLTFGGLQTDRAARDHALAVQLLEDMAERIRANPAAAPHFALAEGAAAPAPETDCAAPGTCSPTQYAAAELYEWQQRLGASLPQPRSSITVEAVAAGRHRCTLTLQWAGAGSRAPRLVQAVLT